MQPRKLNRRQFLKLIGLGTSLAVVPTWAGYALVQDCQGAAPPNLSPFAPVHFLDPLPQRAQDAAPIVLLVNDMSENPFGAYYAEILRAEGLNCFQMVRLSHIAQLGLDWFDQIILTEGALDSTQRDWMRAYVARGGRLVAFRPGANLADLFGVSASSGSAAEGYLQIDAAHPIAAGMPAVSLQYHGIADHFKLAGAQPIAWLNDDSDARTAFPALTLHAYGRGRAAMWAFDLARSIAYTRQGNPALADCECDGFRYIRASDMFIDWLDLDRIAIPQADALQRLFANLLTALSEERRPLPRVWYFPAHANAVLVCTSDAHENPAWAIDDLVERVERYAGHISVYYAPTIHSAWRRALRKARFMAAALPILDDWLAEKFCGPTPTDIARWRARGHEFALHPYVDIHPRLPAGLEAGWRGFWDEYTGLGYGSSIETTRTHAVMWQGWVASARLQATYGVRMNLDYYHVGPAFRKTDGVWVLGHFTGSGRPMRFVDEQGHVLNIYQQLTQLTDEHILQLKWGSQMGLSAQDAIAVSRALLECACEDYCAVGANFHTDPFQVGGECAVSEARWLEGTLETAQRLAVPIWSAQEWLHFTEARHDAEFARIEWQSSQRLCFDWTAQGSSPSDFGVLIPLAHNGHHLTRIEIDGCPVGYTDRQVGGVRYGGIHLNGGTSRVEAYYG